MDLWQRPQGVIVMKSVIFIAEYMKKNFSIFSYGNKHSGTETVSFMESFFNKPFSHILSLFLLGLIAYSNTFSVPFHFDDVLNIVNNPRLRDLSNFWPPSGARWFGFLTFALNYSLGGLDTTGYHIVNLAIHIINAILVYWLVLLTFKTPYFQQFTVHNSRLTVPIALFSSMLFVSHPIQTQAVTYIVQRFTSLATMFYLLSIVMYIKSRFSVINTSGFTLYAISLLSAVLAMKTKEIAFTLPFIIILFEFSFLNDPLESKHKSFSFKSVLFLLPFFLTLLVIPLSLIGMDKISEDALRGLKESTTATNEISRADYFFTQLRVIITYIRLLFLPVEQSVDYSYPLYHSFFDADVFLSFLFLIFILGIGFYLYCRYRFTPDPLRLTAFGIFWFFITLSVESSIIPISDVIFEHRLYLPGIGIFIAVTAVIFRFSDRIRTGSRQTWKILLTACVLIISILTVAAYSRNKTWLKEITLWEDVIRKNPENVRGYNMVGIIHKDNGDFEKAISAYRIALQLKPDNAGTHVNLGNVYISKGMLDEALREFLAAVSLQGMDSIDTSALYINLGTLYMRKGLPDKAVEYYTYALKIFPEDALTYYNLGIAYKSKGARDKAAEYFEKAHMLNPDKY